MAGVPYDLKGLKETLVAHKNLFGDDKKTRKITSGGKEVDENKVKDAMKALDEAVGAVSEVCQQGLLAIEVEP
jgi:hypothetical protein